MRIVLNGAMRRLNSAKFLAFCELCFTGDTCDPGRSGGELRWALFSARRWAREVRAFAWSIEV
jgi:hypothetical protein